MARKKTKKSKKDKYIYRRGNYAVYPCRTYYGKTYYTIANLRTGQHSHCDNYKGALMICNSADKLNIPDRYSDFMAEAVRRLIG